MPQPALSAKRGSLTAASHVYFTPSCTGWTFLSWSSTSSERLFTGACSARLHNIWSDCCTPSSNIASRQRLRSASRHQLDVARHYRSKFGRRAFSIAGPIVWNSLPAHLRDPSLSSDSFKPALKTHLFMKYQ